jgi:hypothetical protein
MHFPIRGRFSVLFSAVLLSLALIAACGGDDDGGSNGQASPNGATPTVSFTGIIGEGTSPLEAVGTILNYEGLGGQQLKTDLTAECPLENVTGTPGVNARYSLGQFCLTFINFTSTQGGITVVENMEDGGIWNFTVSVNDGTWKVEDVEEVSDGG